MRGGTTFARVLRMRGVTSIATHATAGYCATTYKRRFMRRLAAGVCSLVGADELLELFGVRAGHLAAFCAVFVELKSRHALNTTRCRRLLVFIDVDLDEHDVAGVFLVHLLEDRRDALARSAPRCSEVHDDELVASTLERGVEVGLGRE